MVLFVVGTLILALTNTDQAIHDAGNAIPRKMLEAIGMACRRCRPRSSTAWRVYPLMPVAISVVRVSLTA